MASDTSSKIDYAPIIEAKAQHVFDVMAPRTADADLLRLKDAFELAKEAHAPQIRKTGEPYIFHPIAVATIAAEELQGTASKGHYTPRQCVNGINHTPLEAVV